MSESHQGSRRRRWGGRSRPAVDDLLQLSDDQLFEEVSVGITHIVDHARSLESLAVRLVEMGEGRGAAVIRGLANEESAKVLILVDLVRCPCDDRKARKRTLAAFRDHLAKAIYSDACNWNRCSYLEVTSAVERERCPYYLDGPNDVDWIFENSALGRRQSQMYVDYVQDITVADGEHHWVSPLCDVPDAGYNDSTPTSLIVARALHRVGMTTPEGLAVVASLWRGFEPQPQHTWQERVERNADTLVNLVEAGQYEQRDGDSEKAVCHHWSFPLWQLDLVRPSKKPTKADLRRQRAKHIRWRRKVDSERDPAPLVTREKVEELTNAHSEFEMEWERLIASLPENRNSGLRFSKGSVRSYELESYERLLRLVGSLDVEELRDIAALGWFGRSPRSGWLWYHEHARNIISEDSVGYVCGLGRYWIKGLDRWERPAQFPDSFSTVGDDVLRGESDA